MCFKLCVRLCVPCLVKNLTMTLKGKFYYPTFINKNVQRLVEMVVLPRVIHPETQNPGFPKPRPIRTQRHTNPYMWMCGRVHAGSPAWEEGTRKDRTDAIRVGPLLFGFTSNKDDSRETEAPLPSLKTQAQPKNRSDRKHLIY